MYYNKISKDAETDQNLSFTGIFARLIALIIDQYEHIFKNIINEVIPLNKITQKLLLVTLILLTVISLFGCFEEKADIIWQDSDGEVLNTVQLPYSKASSATFPLPEDSNEWHYTGWKEISTSTGFAYIAQRLPKTKHIWLDSDGNAISEAYVVKGEDAPTVDLPRDNEKWIYTDWTCHSEKGTKTYTANRIANTDYFVGNVFQIVIKNNAGEPVSTGSGFVLNEQGWFITNNHVMDGADSAIAFFDIKDSTSGTQYTRLDIIGGICNDPQKDIFVGKLDNYAKIKKYYNDISLTTEYTEGEKSYSVGYPNSSVKMEINGGVILEEYSNINDKINEMYYILSDSYIAPGSSGGILVNEKFQVIGITTIGIYSDDSHEIYEAGGSVPTIVFTPFIVDLYDSKLKPLNEIYQ